MSVPENSLNIFGYKVEICDTKIFVYQTEFSKEILSGDELLEYVTYSEALGTIEYKKTKWLDKHNHPLILVLNKKEDYNKVFIDEVCHGWFGTSILIELIEKNSFKYLFIGDSIFTFYSEDEIVNFHSPTDFLMFAIDRSGNTYFLNYGVKAFKDYKCPRANAINDCFSTLEYARFVTKNHSSSLVMTPLNWSRFYRTVLREDFKR